MNQNTDDCIFCLTRVPAEGFDSFMEDPEVVIATVEDLGFELDDMLNSVTSPQADPAALYHMMEGRWSGEQPTFSLEKMHHLLCFLVSGSASISEPSSHPLSVLFSGGRNTQIYNEYGAIRVLSPSQVSSLSEVLEGLGLTELLQKAEQVGIEAFNQAQLLPHKGKWTHEHLDDLWTLYPALQTFFQIASSEGEFVLLSLQ